MFHRTHSAILLRNLYHSSSCDWLINGLFQHFAISVILRRPQLKEPRRNGCVNRDGIREIPAAVKVSDRVGSPERNWGRQIRGGQPRELGTRGAAAARQNQVATRNN